MPSCSFISRPRPRSRSLRACRPITRVRRPGARSATSRWRRKMRVTVWTWGSIERFLQDVRYAMRVLGRQRSFTATALATIVLIVGGTTAVFTLVQRRAAPAAAVPGIWPARHRPGPRSARRDRAVLSRCATAPGRARKLRRLGTLPRPGLHSARSTGIPTTRCPFRTCGLRRSCFLFSVSRSCSAVRSRPTMR